MRSTLVFLTLIFLVGCVPGKQTYTITDITKQSTITLRKLRSQGDIHSMTLTGKGHIDGNAKIVLILNGKPYKTESLSGDIDFKWRGDWYSDSAQIVYKPSSVRRGYLVLQYKFEDVRPKY